MDEFLKAWSALLNRFEAVDVTWAISTGAMAAAIAAFRGYGDVLLLLAFAFVSCLTLAVFTTCRRFAWRRRGKKGIANESVMNQTKGWP
jgi:hypothetical protein